MTKHFLILFAAALMLGGCSTARVVAGGDTVDNSYTVGGMRWQGGGGVYVVAKAMERDGKIAVCGAYTTDGLKAHVVRYTPEILSGMIVEVDGQRAFQNVSFFNGFNHDDDWVGQPTTCAVTDLPWVEGLTAGVVEIISPRRTFWS
ncbi:MAG: hypothetical protein AAFQ88_10280 [Pseudomonadota bacterium]